MAGVKGGKSEMGQEKSTAGVKEGKSKVKQECGGRSKKGRTKEAGVKGGKSERAAVKSSSRGGRK